MRLRDVLDPQRHAADTVDAGDPTAFAVEFLRTDGRGACVVIGSAGPVGLLSAGDLMKCLHADGFSLDVPVRHVMTHSPMVADINAPVVDTAREMIRRGADYLPVMDGARVAGLLRLAELSGAAIDVLQEELSQLEGYIADLHSARDD